MAFFNTAVTVLQTLVTALGAGLAIWGVINLMEGYGSDNPGAKSQGMKQLMAGGGVALSGRVLVPQIPPLLKKTPNAYCPAPGRVMRAGARKEGLPFDTWLAGRLV